MTKFSPELHLKRNSDKTKKIRSLPKMILYLMATTLIIGASVVYLVEINYITARGFYMREVEQKINAAKEENEKFSLQVIQIKSMSNLSEKIAELDMVPAEKITYYNSVGQTVAQR